MLSVVAPVLAAVILAATAVEVSAAGSRRGWKSTRYGRKGAEMWVEFPRVVYATGAGYSEEHDVTEGLGFGFGMMWGISDNIAFEGRMVQSNHTVNPGEEETEWDIDLFHLGARYTFFEEHRLQPFVGTGWAKLTMERDAEPTSSDAFERLTGYGPTTRTAATGTGSSGWKRKRSTSR
jgi:hypothetical protein